MCEKPKHYMLYFFSFSFIGWIWEILVGLVLRSKMGNPGTLIGPWLPIYGWVAIFIIMISKKVKNKYALFFVSFLLVGIIEYTTSCFLEYLYNARWWNYYDYLLNIDGRVCIEALIVFSFIAVFSVYYVVPKLDKIYEKTNKNVFNILISLLIIMFVIDFIYSSVNPNKGKPIFLTKYTDQELNNTIEKLLL